MTDVAPSLDKLETLASKLERLANSKDWGTGYGVEVTMREASTGIISLIAAAREGERMREAWKDVGQDLAYLGHNGHAVGCDLCDIAKKLDAALAKETP